LHGGRDPLPRYRLHSRGSSVPESSEWEPRRLWPRLEKTEWLEQRDWERRARHGPNPRRCSGSDAAEGVFDPELTSWGEHFHLPNRRLPRFLVGSFRWEAGVPSAFGGTPQRPFFHPCSWCSQ